MAHLNRMTPTAKCPHGGREFYPHSFAGWLGGSGRRPGSHCVVRRHADGGVMASDLVVVVAPA